MNYTFRSLQVLESLYRNKSVAVAARELDISPSAVSHQLRKLSEDLGEKLIERNGRQVALTENGRRIAQSLTGAFSQIDRILAESVGTARPAVRLAMCSSFGPGWLIKRLRRLREENPGLDLHILMYAGHPELSDIVADAFVTAYPLRGYTTVPLFEEALVAVHRCGEDTAALPLITTDIDKDEYLGDWKQFEADSGLALRQIADDNILGCSHFLFALEMARHGLGVALIPDFLAEDYLESGELSLLCNCQTPSSRAYFFCVKEARESEPALKALMEWLTRQASESATAQEEDKSRIGTAPAGMTTDCLRS